MKKPVVDPNCPPGMVYVMNPDMVQMWDGKGKVTKPLKNLVKNCVCFLGCCKNCCQCGCHAR